DGVYRRGAGACGFGPDVVAHDRRGSSCLDRFWRFIVADGEVGGGGDLAVGRPRGGQRDEEDQGESTHNFVLHSHVVLLSNYRFGWCDTSWSSPVVLHDPVEDPPACVLTPDALGLLEQAEPASSRSRRILRENRLPAQQDRRSW